MTRRRDPYEFCITARKEAEEWRAVGWTCLIGTALAVAVLLVAVGVFWRPLRRSDVPVRYQMTAPSSNGIPNDDRR